MALTNSAARSRVQSLYGTTIAGRLHCADRFLIAKFHSDPHAHVRFQPEDESLPRFRIPVSEFPDANWQNKTMQGKWNREVTVEPHDWPPEKKLPSAKFNPPLATQLEINSPMGKSKNVKAVVANTLQPVGLNSDPDQSSNDPQSKSVKKKKVAKILDEQEPSQAHSPQQQQNPPRGRKPKPFVANQNVSGALPEEDVSIHATDQRPDSVDPSRSRSGNRMKKKKHPADEQDSYEESQRRPGPLRPSAASLNRRLVEHFHVVSPNVGRPRRPDNSLTLNNNSEYDDGSVVLISSEDESRRSKPGQAQARPLVPRGNYVCYRCNVPGHFIADCPIRTPQYTQRTPRGRANELNGSNEAVSESSVRFLRFRPNDDDGNCSPNEIPVRNLNFRRRKDHNDSEPNATNDRKKSTPKKAFYKEYLNDEEVAAGLADNSLVQGVLHVSAKRATEAYVRRSDLDGGIDIKIFGHHHRNRAYDGDTVIVKILADQESSDDAKESSDAGGDDLEPAPISDDFSSTPATLESLTAKLDAVILSDGADPEEENNRTRQLGEVVAIKTQAKDVAVDIIGYLKLSTSKEKAKVVTADDDTETIKSNRFVAPAAPVCPEPSNVIMFQPVSKRIPRGFLQNSLWPADLRSSDPELVKMAWNSIYSASYGPWKVYQKSPRVAKLDLIGSAGHVESETKALLRATKISHSEAFPPEVFDCLREFGCGLTAESGKNWVIPSKVISERRDFREARVFSIDPTTAKDLDDALSITKISDDIFEIGVHIADVAYFVKEDSPLDLEARKRCTSVYLVQKVIPMLPPLLCEELCSLNPGVDRLTFSAVWRMHRNGRICSDVEPWFGRTVIRSCAKLDYRTAQRIVDGEPDIKIDIHGNHSFHEIANDCKQMMEIAMARRAHRFDSGSLKLDRPKMHFQFDDDLNPVSVAAYELHDSNRMIEEYMLLANLLVAEKLAKDIPDVALLRRHVPPVPGKLNEILAVCSKLGYEVDGQSSQSLHRTLMEIEEEDVRGFISVLLTVAMRRAEYLCINGLSGGMDEILEEKGFAHYALGFDAYTHFTSPIRRYADVIVHRMMEHCVARDSDPSKIKKLPDPEEVSKMATRCNEMKNRAKDAQDMSLLMYLAVLVRKQALVESAYVMDLGVKAFCVYIPRLGLEDRIMIEKIPNIKKAEIKKKPDSELKTLFLEWEDGHTQTCGMFEPLRVQVGVSSTVPYTVELTVLPKLSTENN